MAIVKRDRTASTHLDPFERLFGGLPAWGSVARARVAHG